MAAAELFGVLRRVGYEPVALAGIVGSVGLVLGAYNNGTAIIPSILFLTTAVCLLWYLVGAATEAPVMNIGVTLLGVLWVGLFGSFAALMLGARAIPASGSCSPPSSAPSATTSAGSSSARTPDANRSRPPARTRRSRGSSAAAWPRWSW